MHTCYLQQVAVNNLLMKHGILYILCGVVLASLTVGCAGNIQRVLKSGKPEDIYAKAIELYNAEKWSKASTLFEAVEHYYSGTLRADSVAYYNARCKYKNRDYDTAIELLDEFRNTYGGVNSRCPFIEDAEGMYALSHYYLAPGPTRDQTMTGKALIAINSFISRYPNSQRLETFKSLDKELQQRLHDKAFINAYTYYKIGKHKSAIVAFKNALRQYPMSSHREELMYYIISSGYELASNSIESKQTDRYLSMLDSYYSFIAEFPESKYKKDADKMARQAKDYLDKNNKDNI